MNERIEERSWRRKEYCENFHIISEGNLISKI